jgi:hypothetical protein
MPNVVTTTSLEKPTSLSIGELEYFKEEKIFPKSLIALLALYLTYGTFEVTLSNSQIDDFLTTWELKHSDLLAVVTKLESKSIVKLNHNSELFQLTKYTTNDEIES